MSLLSIFEKDRDIRDIGDIWYIGDIGDWRHVSSVLLNIFEKYRDIGDIGGIRASIAGLRCEFGGHLPISSKKCPRPIQVVLGGSYAF